MGRGRILALDYGSKHIGVALSDELGISIRPLPSIPNVNRRHLLRRLKLEVKEREVDSLVIGLPLNMDGTAGDAVRQVRRFIRELHRETGLPCREFDERLSTLEAMDRWRAMSSRHQRKYRTVDSLAAALILERFLRESPGE